MFGSFLVSYPDLGRSLVGDRWKKADDDDARKKREEKKRQRQEMSKREKCVLNVSQTLYLSSHFGGYLYDMNTYIQFDNMIWRHLYKKKKKKTRRIPRPRTSLRPSLPLFPFTYICGWHQQGETFSLPLPSHDDNGGRRRRQTVWPKAKKKRRIDWGRKMFRRAIFTTDKLLNTHTAFERNVLFLVIIACTSIAATQLKSSVNTTHVLAEK